MASLGFLGFGEAGSTLAAGFAAAGLRDIVAYDIAAQDSALVCRRASEEGVDLVTSPSRLAEHAEVVISVVVCTEAAAAARSVLPHLRKDHVFLDLNSTAPSVKRAISASFADCGVPYVDVAVMSNVTSDLARLPLLAAGSAAAEIVERFPDVALNVTAVSASPGDASRIKMLRSLFVKGLEALSLEVMMAAYPNGLHEVVLNSFQDSFGHFTFPQLVQHLIGRHAVHGERRSKELSEVASTLREVGVDPIMAEAAAERSSWDVRQGLQKRFAGEGEGDPDWLEVLTELDSLDGAPNRDHPVEAHGRMHVNDPDVRPT